MSPKLLIANGSTSDKVAKFSLATQGGFMKFREYIPKTPVQNIWAELELSSDDAELRGQVKDGLSVKIFHKTTSLMGVTQTRMCKALKMSSSTLQRRKRDGRFTAAESARLYNFIEVFARAIDLFEGDRIAAAEWITKEAPGLGYKRPIDMIDFHINTQAVLDLITRLEHGVYI